MLGDATAELSAVHRAGGWRTRFAVDNEKKEDERYNNCRLRQEWQMAVEASAGSDDEDNGDRWIARACRVKGESCRRSLEAGLLFWATDSDAGLGFRALHSRKPVAWSLGAWEPWGRVAYWTGSGSGRAPVAFGRLP